MPLLHTDLVKIFEFGNCFSVDSNDKEIEWRSIVISVDDGKKNKNYKEEIENILNEIKKEFNIQEIKYIETKNASQKENCIEINFEKEIDGVKKKSFGFRLIYQDKEKTLTDEEVNQEAERVYEALKQKGFEIR